MAKRKKGKKIIIALIIVLVIFLLGFLAFKVIQRFAGMGFGIKASQASYDQIKVKLGYEEDQAPTEGKREDYEYIYGPPIEAEANLTSEEITSMMTINNSNYAPFKKTQVRVNKNGTIDMSTTVNINDFLSNFLGDATLDDIELDIPFLDKIPGKIPLKMNFEIRIKDNKVDKLDVKSFKVFGIKVPVKYFQKDEANEEMIEMINAYIEASSKLDNSYFELIEVVDGQVYFKGMVPSSLTRVKKE